MRHSAEIEGLGWGARDCKIEEYANQKGFVLVTRDMGLLGRCLDHGIKTAFYYKGKAYILKLEDVIEIGLNADQFGFVAP